MSEGKYDRSERKDSSKRESLIEQVRNFCMSSQLEEEFEQFARDNQDVFMSSLEMKENEEHPLAFHEVYQKYLQKFERSIENFIESVSIRAKFSLSNLISLQVVIAL